MKKLMFAAVAAFCATVVANADGITSANIVGYISKTSVANNNFYSAPFLAVGYNTVDIQDISIQGDGVGLAGAELFSIWSGVPTVVENTEFVYWDGSYAEQSNNYWGDDECGKVDFSFDAADGFVLNLGNEGAGRTVQMAGQVSTEDVTFTSVANNNFSGNPFPADIDIQDIEIVGDGVGLAGAELFSIWSGIPTVVEDTEFVYWDGSYAEQSKNYWGDEECGKINFTIASGRGFVLNLGNEGAGRVVTIRKPNY